MISVFIDSNILFEDYFFEHKSNKKLLDYCEEGLLRIYMSDVVRLELRRQYQKEIESKNLELNRIKKDSARLKLNDVLTPIDLDSQLKKFDDFYHGLILIDDFEILNAKNEYLPDIIHRAVNRIKPFSEEKSELKDAIIWKTYSEFVESGKMEDCILLTNNTSDFCQKKDKSAIHSVLAFDTARFYVINSAFQFIKEKAPTLESPESQFQAYIRQIEVTNEFALNAITENFEKQIEEQIHDRIDNLNPSDVLEKDYFFDGQLIPFGIEILECEDVEYEVFSETALVSGIVHVSCETEIWEYNAVRDPGEDRYSTVGEVWMYYKLYFNFDLKKDEVCADFEITDFELTKTN